MATMAGPRPPRVWSYPFRREKITKQRAPPPDERQLREAEAVIRTTTVMIMPRHALPPRPFIFQTSDGRDGGRWTRYCHIFLP